MAEELSLQIKTESRENTYDKPTKKEPLGPFQESGQCWDEATFEFEDGGKLYVSQNFLSLASPVFAAMFGHDFEEKKTKTVKMVEKELNDVLELLLCLHPNIQKPVTFKNVLCLAGLAEEYQCTLIIDRCKAKMSEYLKHEIQRAEEADTQRRYKCMETCLKILAKVEFLNYEELITEATEIITRFNFKYFTGKVRNNASLNNIRQNKKQNAPQGFLFGSPAQTKPSPIFSTSQSPVVSRADSMNESAKLCKELYENLPEKIRYSLLINRLHKCDEYDII